MVNGKHISEFFNGLRSPLLVHVDSSCDFRVSFIFWRLSHKIFPFNQKQRSLVLV